MVNFDGKEYKRLALHGGGNPMFGHYVGLFETLKWFEDWESFNIPLITSSAGSMAILYFLLKNEDKEVVNSMFSKASEEFENVLENIEQKSVISFDFLKNIFNTQFASVKDITFRDLNEMYPNLEWTVCCSKYDNFEFSLQTYGTHTPEVLVWKACIASMAIPIIFEPVEINGCLNCDGDLSNWVEKMNLIDDSDVLHIGPAKNSNGIGLDVITDIPLLDEAIKMAICCFLRMFKAKQPAHGILRTEFISSIHRHFLSEEYIESGKLMAEKLA